MKILVPVDGSPLSLEAVRHALWLVRQGLRAELLLVNVQEPASLYELVVAHDPDVIRHVSVGAGAHQLEPARALCRAAGVPFDTEVLSGDPVRTICELAEERGCAQIIVGGHGKGALASVLAGSFSQAVAHSATVPVTVVKSGEERVTAPRTVRVAPESHGSEVRPH